MPEIHDHICRCPGCCPDYFPRGPREVEGHIGERFADSEREPRWWAAVVRVGGRPEWHATEVRPGPEGYVVRASTLTLCAGGVHARGVCATHLCLACGSDEICREVVRGDVRIEYSRPRVPILAAAR